jgi:hypothetical protein
VSPLRGFNYSLCVDPGACAAWLSNDAPLGLRQGATLLCGGIGGPGIWRNCRPLDLRHPHPGPLPSREREKTKCCFKRARVVFCDPGAFVLMPLAIECCPDGTGAERRSILRRDRWSRNSGPILFAPFFAAWRLGARFPVTKCLTQRREAA